MVGTMMGARRCHMIGGPLAGWEGDYIDKGQTVAFFGDGPERGCYVYRLRPDTVDKPLAVWVFDGKESSRLLRAAGLVNDGETGVAT